VTYEQLAPGILTAKAARTFGSVGRILAAGQKIAAARIDLLRLNAPASASAAHWDPVETMGWLLAEKRLSSG
jgi:hypothetical protein